MMNKSANEAAAGLGEAGNALGKAVEPIHVSPAESATCRVPTRQSGALVFASATDFGRSESSTLPPPAFRAGRRAASCVG